MGLDQYLYAKNYYSSYSTSTDLEDFHKLMEISKVAEYAVPDDMWVRSVLLSVKVGQWRKAYHIHQWFAGNTNYEENNGAETYVPREDLSLLLESCEQVIADHSKAEELFPVGLLWGDDAPHDEYFYMDIDYTAKLIKHLLTMPDSWEFYYHASW